MAWIVCGGLAAGAAATTRPTMMLFMPVAAILAALAMFLARRYILAVAAPLLLAVCCMAAIAPITYRNFVMSRKIVLVTGAQQGIGRAMALEFAAAGADVAVNWIDDQAAAARVCMRFGVVDAAPCLSNARAHAREASRLCV